MHNPHGQRRFAPALAIATVGLTLAACTGPATAPTTPTASAPATVADASIKGLRILMTNDDSMQASNERNSDGLGLYELRHQLCNAGADVVVIAPWAVQSGRGTAVTNSGTFQIAEPPAIPEGYADDCAGQSGRGAVYGLCLDDGPCTPESPSATPADTVKFALRGGLETLVGWTDRPDLVVSGPNAGLNVASSVNDSGTVAAAIAGLEHRIPAFAVSTGGASGSYPIENYRATATWTTSLLEALAARDMLEQHHFVTSVNYPNVSSGKQAGSARFVEVGTSAFAWHYYDKQDGGGFKIGLRTCEGVDLCEEAKPNADWEALMKDGVIGVGAITPDRTYGTEIHGQAALAGLRAFVETDAPAPVS